jgi:hypothetical protein
LNKQVLQLPDGEWTEEDKESWLRYGRQLAQEAIEARAEGKSLTIMRFRA